MMRITLELVQCMIEPNSDGNPLLAATAANHKSSWLDNLGDLCKRSQRNMQSEKPLIFRPLFPLLLYVGYASFSFYIQYLLTVFFDYLLTTSWLKILIQQTYRERCLINNSLSLCRRLRIKFPPHKCPWRIFIEHIIKLWIFYLFYTRKKSLGRTSLRWGQNIR